ncbi:hypothetical protein LHJ74_19580 [Streptomyces sp. N2-109]|uniref:DUF3558 domain-containing protein n=1 Tax=Streptomyces gossypii TaxID=2883101 RepID=A0ABT2JWG9_9ACTN|nr:hypothetical protein [Streptomyces gossypii]MCT2592076.1 hypothetical protein [Streptomyces gossypii]
MRRRARTCVTSAVLAVALAGGLSACTGSSDSKDGTDAKPGGGSASPAAPPGKYRTLPEPCGAVSRDTLKKMLPEAESEAESESADSSSDASPYEGEASVTYDTDRRVGCTWDSASSAGSRHLTIDLERVVSYDPAVSDDEQTELLYGKRADDAGISVTDPAESGEDSGTSGPDTLKPGGEADASSQPGSDPDSASGTSGGSGDAGSDDGDLDDTGDPGSPSPSQEEALPSRNLDGIGDAAFLDDEVVTTESGRATHRDVTLVFRTENVLVTVEYTQAVADDRSTPNGAELQEQAQNLARQLTGKINDN